MIQSALILDSKKNLAAQVEKLKTENVAYKNAEVIQIDIFGLSIIQYWYHKKPEDVYIFISHTLKVFDIRKMLMTIKELKFIIGKSRDEKICYSTNHIFKSIGSSIVEVRELVQLEKHYVCRRCGMERIIKEIMGRKA